MTYFLETYAFYAILSYLVNIHEADSHKYFFSTELIFNLLLLAKINTNITRLSLPEVELVLFNWPLIKI